MKVTWITMEMKMDPVVEDGDEIDPVIEDGDEMERR